jgi:flagellar biosynthesis protein FlhF
LLIVDSAGFDPRKPSQEIRGYAGAQNIEALGVISATTDALEAVEMAAAFVQLGVKRLVVTGLDLARRKGALATLAVSGLAIAQVTASPYLAQGCRYAHSATARARLC